LIPFFSQPQPAHTALRRMEPKLPTMRITVHEFGGCAYPEQRWNGSKW
jgi:hypothetical protein